MNHDERYQVRNLEIERALRTLAALIDGEIPDGWGFALFLVPFGENAAAPAGRGAVFWISNSDRDGMIDAIRGFIEDHDRRRAAGAGGQAPERLAPGVYVTADGALHLDVAELLKAAGVADTPANRQQLVDAAHSVVRQRWPTVKIVDV